MTDPIPREAISPSPPAEQEEIPTIGPAEDAEQSDEGDVQ
jgi:hypothetical protein